MRLTTSTTPPVAVLPSPPSIAPLVLPSPEARAKLPPLLVDDDGEPLTVQPSSAPSWICVVSSALVIVEGCEKERCCWTHFRWLKSRATTTGNMRKQEAFIEWGRYIRVEKRRRKRCEET